MRILVVDDDKDLNRGICTFLNSREIETKSAFNGKDALNEINNANFDLILSDFQMPELNGLEMIKELRHQKIEIPVIMMTAFSSVENAVEAMKNGAEDYLTKPVNLQELIIRIEKLVISENIKRENKELKKKIESYELPEIIGESEGIKELKETLRRISNDSDIPVTIFGKSGTGKELVARNIHFMSNRKDKPFLPINCAVLSDDLLESELFGHEKGAFTGAIQKKVGLLETANGGSVFLDEISEMTPRVQSKLLRVLEDGVIQPIGANNMISVDVRFISASNQKLSDLVDQNKFRDDLFYRLNVIEIEIPPLTSRKKDIPILIKHLLNKYNESNRIFSADLLNILESYTWPGNIRELENLVRNLLVTTQKNIIEYDDLPARYKLEDKYVENKKIFLESDYKIAFNRAIINFEKSYLIYHLKKHDMNISRTAESINLSRVSLHKKIKEYSISIE